MSTEQGTDPQVPPGKVPLDFLMYLREIRNVALSKKTGISEQNISRYRRGLRPSAGDRKKIAKFLKVSQADLGWDFEDVKGECEACGKELPGRPSNRRGRAQQWCNDACRKRGERSREDLREKHLARDRLTQAVKRGDLERAANCESCGAEENIEAHHADYSKPLEVEWLCRRCHRALHAEPANV